MKLTTGDIVTVISGKDSGNQGEIVKLWPKKFRATVKGVNLVKRHLKPREGPEGGIIELEKPIHISNLALVDPKTKKPTRVGYQIDSKGKKIRFAKKSGQKFAAKTSTAKSSSGKNK